MVIDFDYGELTLNAIMSLPTIGVIVLGSVFNPLSSLHINLLYDRSLLQFRARLF